MTSEVMEKPQTSDIDISDVNHLMCYVCNPHLTPSTKHIGDPFVSLCGMNLKILPKRPNPKACSMCLEVLKDNGGSCHRGHL